MPFSREVHMFVLSNVIVSLVVKYGTNKMLLLFSNNMQCV